MFTSYLEYVKDNAVLQTSHDVYFVDKLINQQLEVYIACWNSNLLTLFLNYVKDNAVLQTLHDICFVDKLINQ